MKKCFCIIPFNFSNDFPDFKNLEIFSVLSKLGFFENLLFNRKSHSTLSNAGLLAKGSQTPASSSKRAARADPHIHVDSSLKSTLVKKEEWIKVFLLPFMKGKKICNGSSITQVSFQN